MTAVAAGKPNVRKAIPDSPDSDPAEAAGAYWFGPDSLFGPVTRRGASPGKLGD